MREKEGTAEREGGGVPTVGVVAETGLLSLFNTLLADGRPLGWAPGGRDKCKRRSSVANRKAFFLLSFHFAFK